MGRTLVLNATYEPLAVVPMRRALVLVLDRKADLLHEGGGVYRSEHLSIPIPSVVRLRHFVRVPYRPSAALSRKAVFIRDEHRCQYCGARADSIDHVLPRSRGGPHTWENVVAACRGCNVRKRDRLLHQSGMRLHRRPQAPRPGSWVRFSVTPVPAMWEEYLDPHGRGGAVGCDLDHDEARPQSIVA